MIDRMKRNYRWFLVPTAILVIFLAAEEALLKAHLLNTKDLAGIGSETGTVVEYLMNVWYWDLFGGLLAGITILCYLIGFDFFMTIPSDTQAQTPHPQGGEA